MFIVSQGKKRICPTTVIIKKGKTPATDEWWIWGTKKCKYNFTIETDNYILGEYSTEKQRDEVWEDILNWLEYQYNPLFHMPQNKEEEVKEDE